jgi:hypothetical protein
MTSTQEGNTESGFFAPPTSVYAQLDAQRNIIAVGSSMFLGPAPPSGWEKIDEGYGDQYAHAQNHYFEGGARTPSGICRYRWVDGELLEKSADEIQEEEAGQPTPDAQLDYTDFIAGMLEGYNEQ